MNEIEKRSLAIICPTGNFGGMELDSIKLVKKLIPYCNIVFIVKKNGFVEENFNKYFSHEDNVILESFEGNSLLFIKNIVDFRNIIRKHNIKNVIYFGTSKLRLFYFSILGLNLNLIVRHGTTRAKPKKGLFHKMIYSRVNIHIAISKHLLENVKRTFPFGKNTKNTLIYPSINIQDFIKPKNKKLNILHVGRIVKGKGQVDAIKACQILIDNEIDFEFSILGGFERIFEKEFLEFYNEIKYKDKIKLIGFTNEVNKYFVNADIFLFPSYGEGFGNAFIEAISFGCKAISYDNTTFKEFKELGFEFNIVENKNIEELQLSLLEMAKNNIKFNTDKNLELIKNNFSESVEINKYLDVLR